MKVNIKKGKKIFLILGLFLILINFFLNEWTILKFLSSEGVIEFSNKVAIWFFNLFFIFFGLIFVFNRKKTIVCFNFFLLFSTIILFLIGAEIFLRIFEKPNPSTINTQGENIYIFDSEYHHDYRPNQVFTKYPIKYDEFEPIESQINSFGIRGPEIPEKPEKEYRVLLLGDSFIQADEIKYEETAGELVNHKMENKNVKVLQHGIGSWSPLLELNWLYKKGIQLKPDLVIVFLCINDFYSSYSMSDTVYTHNTEFNSNGFPLNFEKPKEEYLSWLRPRLLELIRQFFPKYANFNQEEINNWLKVDKEEIVFSLNSSIAGDIKYSNLIKDIIRLSRSVELWDEEITETVSLSLGYLDKMKEIAEKNNFSLAFAFVPLGWNISKEETEIGRKYYGFSDVIIPIGGINQKINDYCIENNLDYINIYERFKNFAENNKEKVFLTYDGHWNGTGHRILSEIIYDYINKKIKRE